MAKSLSIRIAERTVNKKPTRNAKNRAIFLSLKLDIELALQDRWPIKTIWETLVDEGKIPFGYQAFRGYVNNIIVPAKLPLIALNNKTIENPSEQIQKTLKTQKSSFSFNANPTIEELI